jgi:prepilin-type N-terminal cleavage/methylation domain-containing protein
MNSRKATAARQKAGRNMKAVNAISSAPAAARSTNDEGFTLVEIVIAIVLVGILSAVAVVGIGSLTSKGSQSACKASMDAAKAASVVHFASNATYPTSLTQMTTGASPALTLPDGVTIDVTGLHTVMAGNNWTLTMTVGPPPTFACS